MRVENGVKAGTPDLWGCVAGATPWIETKVHPKYLPRDMGLRKEQHIWFREFGGLCNSWLAVKHGQGAGARLMLVRGSYVAGLYMRARGASDWVMKAEMFDEWRHIEWDSVRELLAG